MQTQAIIFDFNRTLFDPTVYALYHGVLPMLEELHARKRLFLYSRKSWDRSGLLRDLGIERYFHGVHFVEAKTPENLSELMSHHEIEAPHAAIVGDMLSDELCVGSELGLTTIWVQHDTLQIDPHAAPVCVPTHVVRSIPELHDLLLAI